MVGEVPIMFVDHIFRENKLGANEIASYLTVWAVREDGEEQEMECGLAAAPNSEWQQ